MKRKIAILLILCMCFSLIHVYAQTDIYTIQLGAYASEDDADYRISSMRKVGISAFKISTSIHSVFYNTYVSEEDAAKDLETIKKYASEAFVVKLDEVQINVYLGTNRDKNIEIIDVKDSLYDLITKKSPRITISNTIDNNLEYTYRVMEDIELRGVEGESKWYFEVDKELEVKNFKFNLFIRVNDLILRDVSYVTVYMNDIPTQSMRFYDEEGKLRDKWEIYIPLNLINKGYNQIRVATHSRISDFVCDDDKNIANWVIIDRATNYVIKYERKYYSEKIANFPKPFVGIHADDDIGVGIVIPVGYTPEEISAALTLIAHMKESNLGYDTSLTLVTSQDDISVFDSLIYIGNYTTLPEDFKKLVFNQEALNKDDAYLYRRSLDNFKKPLFIILSDNGNSLLNAVKALKNEDLKAQMIENSLVLASDFDVCIKETQSDDYLELSELGLNGIEVKGINKQYTSIGLKIPFDQILADEANIHLNIRYSDNLDFEKSMVSVYINGVPIGSYKLERDKRDLHSITFYIPKELRQRTYYDVRVVFELIPSGIITCERYLASEPWAYIQEDSSFFLPNVRNPLMLLNFIPNPFTKDDDLDNTTIVLPNYPQSEDLKMAGMFAQLIGLGVKDNRGIINAIRGDQLEKKDYENNLIIFGTPEGNSAIKKINNNLWFKYNEEYDLVLSNEKIELLPEYSKSATFIELKPSYYNETKGILSITSLDKESITNAIHYLYKNNFNLLNGDAVIISKTGDFKNFRFQKDSSRPEIDNTQLTTRNIIIYIIFAAAFLALLVIGLLLYLKKNRRYKYEQSIEDEKEDEKVLK